MLVQFLLSGTATAVTPGDAFEPSAGALARRHIVRSKGDAGVVGPGVGVLAHDEDVDFAGKGVVGDFGRWPRGIRGEGDGNVLADAHDLVRWGEAHADEGGLVPKGFDAAINIFRGAGDAEALF